MHVYLHVYLFNFDLKFSKKRGLQHCPNVLIPAFFPLQSICSLLGNDSLSLSLSLSHTHTSMHTHKHTQNLQFKIVNHIYLHSVLHRREYENECWNEPNKSTKMYVAELICLDWWTQPGSRQTYPVTAKSCAHIPTQDVCPLQSGPSLSTNSIVYGQIVH